MVLQIYTQVSIRRLKEVHTLTHPAARLASAANTGRPPLAKTDRAAAEDLLSRPWDAEQPEAWRMSGAPGHGAKCAGCFVLSVWNSCHEWKCGRFDLHEALACRDDEHRRAFSAWIAKPWWP